MKTGEKITGDQARDFIKEWERVSSFVHKNAVDKGFWDKEKNQGEIIALIHSELSEALVGIRHGNPQSDKIPFFSSVEEELADVIIRVMDYARGYGYRVATAVTSKIEYNAKRKKMHGKKF